MPTVVLGDDRSAASDLALAWIEQQTWPGWRLEIVEAVAPPLGPPLDAEITQPHEWQPDEPRQLAATAEFAEVAHLTAAADPRLVLMRSVDLLVIGPRGKGLLKSLRLGSVAEWLLSHPTSPMVIARESAPVRNVLIAHDGSPSASLAVRSFAALPWASSTNRTIAVVDDGRVDVDQAVADAQAAFGAGGSGGAGGSAAPVASTVLKGSVTAAIAGEIDRQKPDLVVLGTRGLTGFRRFHLGSTAGAIARGSTCSVLLACADGADTET